MEKGFRFLVPLVRTGWGITKRTFITGKGDGPGRNNMKTLELTTSSNLGWIGPWGEMPTA